MFNGATAGMRGASSAPDKPLRGAEKIATSAISDALDIADQIVKSRLGEDAGILAGERFLINNGATRYSDTNSVKWIAKLVGPGSLIVGLGLWAWRIFDVLVSRQRETQAAQPVNNILSILRQRTQNPGAQPVYGGPNRNPLDPMNAYPSTGTPTPPEDWQTVINP